MTPAQTRAVSARDIAGIAGLVFVVNSVLGIAGNVFGFGGESLQFARVAGWTLTVLLLAIAGIVHSHQQRAHA